MLWQACQVTFRQSLELLHHFFTLVHSIETMHPKHNFHLYFQGQHTAKRFVLGVDQPSAVHVDSAKHELRSLSCISLIHGVLEPITHSRQDLGSHLKKCTHGGHPLEFPLTILLPHVMTLHQSTLFLTSLNHVAYSASPHSSLISYPVHHGEFAPVDCVVFGSYCGPV